LAEFDYDLFVIGAGSGGVRAARLAALTGARVAIAEESRVGGTCVIRGCVPKKFMVYASEFSRHFKTAEGYGWSPAQNAFDWAGFNETRDIEIARLSGIYVNNLNKAGADLIHERARIAGPHTVELAKSGRRVTAEKILVAVGGRPWMPDDIPGIEHAITSDEAFHIERMPERVLIAGGGYIAVEFACIFAGLGVKTTLVYRGANILRGFDEDVRAHISDEVEKRGVRIVLGCQHERMEKTDHGIVNHLTNQMRLESDVVMFAVGRRPYTADLGLETVGIALNEAGAIVVDEVSKTTCDHVWAVGDVTDRINLTPVAIREGAAFAETEFKNNPTRFDYEMVPTAVFSQPPIGSVGLTEQEARKLCGGPVDVYVSRFRPMKYAFTGQDERCLMKLIVHPETDRILGAHIVAPEAPEMIQFAAIAVKAGVTKAQWDSTCALHPTIAEEMVTMRDKVVPPSLTMA
jgi:glutathione reductase (NADPH)